MISTKLRGCTPRESAKSITNGVKALRILPKANATENVKPRIRVGNISPFRLYKYADATEVKNLTVAIINMENRYFHYSILYYMPIHYNQSNQNLERCLIFAKYVFYLLIRNHYVLDSIKHRIILNSANLYSLIKIINSLLCIYLTEFFNQGLNYPTKLTPKHLH